MVRRLLVLTVLICAPPSAAHAAELTLDNGVLIYTAGVNQRNDVTFADAAPNGAVRVTRDTSEDPDPIAGGAGCSVTAAGSDYICPGVTRIVADVNDRADRITATGLAATPTTLSAGEGIDAIDGGGGNDIVDAGDGDDRITTSAGNDTIDGGAGNDSVEAGLGNDVLRGGEGNDRLTPNVGTDAISGGEGIDGVVYGERIAPRFALDGLANDGDAGENDLIGVDVENVEGFATGTGVVTMIGDGRANTLTVRGGRGDLTGGDGADVLEGHSLDDTFHARDGAPDTILCGGGTDTVEADSLSIDTVSPTCENVSAQAAPGGAFDDRPPLLAWSAPGANASLAANSASTLRVSATDDRGLAKVQFFDDDRLLCEVAVAPFECGYQPRAADVGRNTLIAVAVDTANQTTSLVRGVTVRRFSPPSLTLSRRPPRDRKASYAYRLSGRLERPAAVSPSEGCTGSVTITAKKRSKAVASRRVTLTRTCEYAYTLRFRTRVARTLRVTARFAGNDVLAARMAPSRSIRLG